MLLFWAALHAQTSPLHLDSIMQGEAFVGYLPENIRWSANSRHIYFSWNPEAERLRSTYRTDAEGSAPQRLSPEEEAQLTGRGSYSKDRNWFLYEKNGDVFLLNLENGYQKAITQTVEREAAPRFDGREQHVVYQRGNDLFAWDRFIGTTRQLTNFKSGKAPTDKPSEAADAWLESQEEQLFEVLRERNADSEAQEARRELQKTNHPEPVYLDGQSISQLRVSPDLRFVTYRLTKRREGRRAMMPVWITESGYVEEQQTRVKVGQPEDSHSHWICDLERDTCYPVQTESLQGIYDKPAFLQEYHSGKEPFKPRFDKPRTVILSGPEFSRSGQALVEFRSADNKDRWIALLDLETGLPTVLDHQRDEAWIGGPGISSWNFGSGNLGWMPDQQRIWFQSEESGYSHLYTVHLHTGERKALTAGNYEILSAQLSAFEEYFYLTSNKESPFEQHFYRLPVGGGELERLTTLPGNHEVQMSPDERLLAIRYSYSNQPWELFVQANQPGASPVRITHSTTPSFEAYSWREPELIRFQAQGGAQVPARLYRPDALQSNGAAVIFVHGAGYLQNAHRWWSTYYREYMFHNLLVDQGYTVLDIDYRGSAGHGRDWRTGIYRHMGGKDLSDHVDGARFLVETQGIDSARIGIYGGSYGGFITLMALFTEPGVFRCGAALRSVTDWAHYNHPYTANILNTPLEDSLAYRRSSPIYFAEGLQDQLLILHGMIDDNVQFQDVVRLSQRLIELRKTNWDMAVYPVERHGFTEASSWYDEYRRIYELFEKHLRND
jgi:dipeptidyl aminopeptidase/acylaminoacyl peptidase